MNTSHIERPKLRQMPGTDLACIIAPTGVKEKNGYDKSVLYSLLAAIDQEPNGDLAKYWSFIKRNVKLQMLEDKYNVLGSSSFNNKLYKNCFSLSGLSKKRLTDISGSVNINNT